MPERWGNGRQGWFHRSTAVHGRRAEKGTQAIGTAFQSPRDI